MSSTNPTVAGIIRRVSATFGPRQPASQEPSQKATQPGNAAAGAMPLPPLPQPSATAIPAVPPRDVVAEVRDHLARLDRRVTRLRDVEKRYETKLRRTGYHIIQSLYEAYCLIHSDEDPDLLTGLVTIGLERDVKFLADDNPILRFVKITQGSWRTVTDRRTNTERTVWKADPNGTRAWHVMQWAHDNCIPAKELAQRIEAFDHPEYGKGMDGIISSMRGGNEAKESVTSDKDVIDRVKKMQPMAAWPKPASLRVASGYVALLAQVENGKVKIITDLGLAEADLNTLITKVAANLPPSEEEVKKHTNRTLVNVQQMAGRLKVHVSPDGTMSLASAAPTTSGA